LSSTCYFFYTTAEASEKEEGGKEEEEEEEDAGRRTRRAIMAIEPVDGLAAGDDRFKCIRSVAGGSGFLVVTANSGGVVSLMDLEGAARMMLDDADDDGDDDDDSEDEKNDSRNRTGGDDDDEDDEEVEAAVEILDSVRVGSGARITDLAVWSYGGIENNDVDDFVDDESREEEESESSDDDVDEAASPVDDDDGGEDEGCAPPAATKAAYVKGAVERCKRSTATIRGRKGRFGEEGRIELNAEAIERARKLVGQAKEHQKRKKRKLSDKS